MSNDKKGKWKCRGVDDYDNYPHDLYLNEEDGYKTYQPVWSYPRHKHTGIRKMQTSEWEYPYESPEPFKPYTPPESDIPVAKAMYAIVAVVCVCLALSTAIIGVVEMVI